VADRGALNLSLPIDTDFYCELASCRDSFTEVFEHVIPRGEGYGFRVEAGHTFRLTTMERGEALDLCIYNADDVTERYASGTQIAVEGGAIGRFTRIWGTPPRSRPLCTCIAETIRHRGNAHHMREHIAHAAHCNPHHWLLYTGTHPRTCYDNLREGLAMLGLGQRHIHDNVNLFWKTAIDSCTGHYVFEPSDAEDGDCIEFYAELPLLVSISLCPYGDGSVEPDGWAEAEVPVFPLKLELFDTRVAPRAWSG